MTYTDVQNPQWSDEVHSRIDCLVKFNAYDEYLPFTATLDDSTEWGPQIFEECRSGKWGDVAEYIAPEIDHVAIFGTQKESLQMEAERVIAPLDRACKMGLATDAEKELLREWEKYSIVLMRVNPKDAPDIVWPDKPV